MPQLLRRTLNRTSDAHRPGTATAGAAGTVRLVSNETGGPDETGEHIPNGPFTERHPMRRPCGSTRNHTAHKDRVIEQGWGGKVGMWYSCPGWETTHVVTVTAVDGRVVGQRNVDLRELDNPGRYLGPNTAEVAMIYEARQAARELSADELVFGAAVTDVGPEVCPYDCDRCHEHLYQVRAELETTIMT